MLRPRCAYLLTHAPGLPSYGVMVFFSRIDTSKGGYSMVYDRKTMHFRFSLMLIKRELFYVDWSRNLSRCLSLTCCAWQALK